MPKLEELAPLPGQPGPPSTQKWQFKCHCGENFVARLSNVRSGRTKSCGCARRRPHVRPTVPKNGPKPLRELPNQSVAPSLRQWEFLCRCGNHFVARLSNVKGGRTRSCGCAKAGNGRPATHGASGTPTYRHWAYAKRFGIDPIWENFQQFFADMGERPGQCRLLRIDCEQPHSPTNSYWGYPAEQEAERLRYAGQLKTVAQWAHEAKLPTAAVKCRLRRGWSVPFALTRYA